jgi:hypothetical protein
MFEKIKVFFGETTDFFKIQATLFKIQSTFLQFKALFRNSNDCYHKSKDFFGNQKAVLENQSSHYGKKAVLFFGAHFFILKFLCLAKAIHKTIHRKFWITI